MQCIVICMTLTIPSMAATESSNNIHFINKPTVTKNNDSLSITFSVNKPTDATISILNADDVVIRHLAAGVLGTNAPAPFQNGLSQTVVWDGKDDFGASVKASESRVRVGLDTKAKFGKIIFYETGIAYSPRAATVGPDGLIYVLMEHGQTKSTFLLQAYTRTGEYVKTIMPYPADLPPEKLTGLPRFKRPNGTYWPAIHHGAFRDLYPDSAGMRAQKMLITSKGLIIMVNASKTHNAGIRDQRLLIIDTNGGTPKDYLGPFASAEKLAHGLCWLAMSPDEKWIYTSGHLKGNRNDDSFKTPPHNVVYRINLDDKDLATPFIGELHTAGNDETHLDHPRGIDTDADGNIYVCDFGNQRIAIFNADGKWIGKLDIANPDQIVVNKKNGAIYVYTRESLEKRKYRSTIVKFKAINSTPTATIDISEPYCTLSIDTTQNNPILWLARTCGERPNKAKRGVERIDDLGDKLSDPVEIIKHRTLPDVYQICASVKNDDVFVHSFSEHQIARVDGITGEVKLLPKLKGEDIAIGPNGNIYLSVMTKWNPGQKKVSKYDRDGVPVSFDDSDSNTITEIPGNIHGHNHSGSKGLAVSPKGEVVILDKQKSNDISVYGSNGKLLSRRIITGLNGACGSPIMDLAGNLYIATDTKTTEYPAIFNTPKPPTKYYEWMYGSVIKFPPTGGSLHYKPRGAKSTSTWPPENAKHMKKLKSSVSKECYVDGSTWVKDGFTIAPRGYNTCYCYTSHFAVDYWNRTFIPDIGQFNVQMSDANANTIISFGDYGNEDSGGPGSKIPKPEIPLSWPYAVTVGKSGVYISDFINRRIVRVDLVSSVEETINIK
ncbi:MAG: hypothetical protein KAI74_07355 [Kiritimatiellae bacterium]|nr:hypothetical protein [Kiritimatiellia bacterium]